MDRRKRTAIVLLAFTLLAALLVTPVSANARTLYVAPNGSNGNAGTEGQPFATVSHALGQLQAGDTLYVRGGTYTEQIRNVRMPDAGAGSPTQVLAYPGETPVLRGLLWVEGGSHWVMDGINVTWHTSGGSSDHMVKITNGRHWKFRNAELSDARSFAAMLIAGTRSGEPANWELTGNCLRNTIPTNATNQDHNLYVNSGLSAGAGLIEGNVFTGAPNGENIKLGPPSSSGGSANVTIRHNTLHNAAQNILISGQSHNIMIERNILGPAGPNYGTVRAYELTGSNNVARDNVGYDASSMINNYNGGNGVSDGGGNQFPVNPNFSGSGCSGLTPTNGQANGYGHTAASAGTAPDSNAPEVIDGSGSGDDGRSSDGFSDIPGNTHEAAIRSLSELGIIQGFSATRFGPSQAVTRGQAASILVRTMDEQGERPPTVSTASFRDVGSSVHRTNILALADQGVVGGTSSSTFSPDTPMTRGQVASVLVGAYEATTRTTVQEGASFRDIAGNAHASNIRRAVHLGLVQGRPDGTYRPDVRVQRDQLASMVHRYREALAAAE
jgi:hypothetical protein